MSEELRQLAHAIKALAESNQGIGGVVREQVASQRETNRVLGLIHDQNAAMLSHMERFNERHKESERNIRIVTSEVRVLKSQLQAHGERIEAAEAALRASKAV